LSRRGARRRAVGHQIGGDVEFFCRSVWASGTAEMHRVRGSRFRDRKAAADSASRRPYLAPPICAPPSAIDEFLQLQKRGAN
jgi:hypothetical protein